MPPMRVRALGVGILVASLLLAGCGSSGNPEDDADTASQLVSAAIGDGLVSVLYDGALPANVSVDDFAVTPIEPLLPEGADAGVASFALSPSGVTFDSPVTISIEFPGPVLERVLALHIGDDGDSELLPVTLAAYDSEREIGIYQFDVDHFSEIHTFAKSKPGQETRFLPPLPRSTYQVGETFTVQAEIRRRELSEDITWANGDSMHLVEVPDTAWSTKHEWQAVGLTAAGALDFSGVWREQHGSEPPPRNQLQIVLGRGHHDPTTFRVEVEQQFTCTEVGPWVINFYSTAVLRAHYQRTYKGTLLDGDMDEDIHARVFALGECVAATTPTATPTTDGAGGGAASATTAATETATTTATPAATSTGEVLPTAIVPADATGITPATGLVPGPLPVTPPGYIYAYAHDGTWYDTTFLIVMDAHPPNCGYPHLHGGPIPSILPVNGDFLVLDEFMGDCGFGPTSAIYLIPDPLRR